MKRDPSKQYSVFLFHHDPERADSVWRVEFLMKLLGDKDLLHIGSLPVGIQFEKTIDISHHLKWNAEGPMVDPFNFAYECKDEDSRLYAEMVARVNVNKIVRDKKTLFIDRPQGRRLLDKVTGRELKDVLLENVDSLEITTFQGLTLEEQMAKVASAHTIIGAHGAALTNIIFAEPGTRVLEVSFRKYWHCDPVCYKHMIGEIPYEEPCSKKTSRPYHKADYRNLAVAFGLLYSEVENEGCRDFLNDNPINVSAMYVDAAKIIKLLSVVYETCPLDKNNYIL